MAANQADEEPHEGSPPTRNTVSPTMRSQRRTCSPGCCKNSALARTEPGVHARDRCASPMGSS